MIVTRRQFLTKAAAVIGTLTAGPAWGASPQPTPGGLTTVEQELRQLIAARALAREDAWVLMHVVVALGAEVRYGSEPVIDFVARRWIEPVAKGGNTFPAFPAKVEAHPNHFLAVLYEVGVAPTRTFSTTMGKITRADLTRGAKALFSPAIDPSELSWTVSVLTADVRPGADRFDAADGRSFTVNAIVEGLAQVTEAGFADTFAAMRGTKPYGRSNLQKFPCNGAHALGGLMDAVRNGYQGNRLTERVRTLVGASVFRLHAEVRLMQQVLGAAEGPLARLNLDAAKLQFIGHSLENLAFAERHAIYRPTAADQAIITAAERELIGVVHRIVAEHDLDLLAREVPRAYGVLLGDACHALAALRSRVA